MNIIYEILLSKEWHKWGLLNFMLQKDATHRYKDFYYFLSTAIAVTMHPSHWLSLTWPLTWTIPIRQPVFVTLMRKNWCNVFPRLMNFSWYCNTEEKNVIKNNKWNRNKWKLLFFYLFPNYECILFIISSCTFIFIVKYVIEFMEKY